ncbi:uncharacterized protein DSM5745_00516 [Aspergillus mulundensis]|uniref:Septin-type G domain-containing protein n=1 Tax=Aspergillus mulundensis TaxID=1810919 RepID=A0A3D8T3R6_9EURO|nr:Uncharacterized protein DSM5745_00516 [Aspergillus mulundensis]RDW93194.1 Uncharacterized protein DSM5745_00516 [Aspergillus mulundensis]
MRPPVPEVASPRSRKSSLEQQQWIDPRSATPSTFFLARSQRPDDCEHESPVEPENLRNSMYGVQSFDETTSMTSSVAALPPDLDTSSVSKPVPIPASPAPPQQWKINLEEADDAISNAQQDTTLKDYDSTHTNRLEPPLHSSNLTSPRPLTPLNFLNSVDHSSLPSSPKSITNQSTRHLDEISITDDLSQAVASGDEDDDSRPTLNPSSDSTSQLIMPSITIPSRRPFTEKGRAFGRVKLLVAGASGSGKTSLIKSIVQICDDIVHVDLFDEPSHSLSLLRHEQTPHTASRSAQSPALISEIYASSKPYPTWWSDLEDSRVLRRRKSSGELVLERNICFVDTPGNRLSQIGQLDAVIRYIRQQLLRATSALDFSNADFRNMLAGNGGSQVDAILYLISQDKLVTDIECISKLSAWTNVVPLIAKSDLLTQDQIISLKDDFNEKARAASVKPFLLDASSDLNEPPFAVSSAKSNDDSIMDASTLMSPDYIEPLVDSELLSLVQTLFDRETLTWIRHSAAKKLAQRQRDIMHRRHNPLQDNALSFSSSPYGLAPSYAMARVSDYSRQEEKRARIQLAKWASDLQQSLQNERERYAVLARGERAVWLTERLGECVVDGSLVPVTQSPGFSELNASPDKQNGSLLVQTQNGRRLEYHFTNISSLDPLGVVRWSDDLKQRGWAIVQIVGSFGVVGGLAIWLAKTWGLSSRSFPEWRFDW